MRSKESLQGTSTSEIILDLSKSNPVQNKQVLPKPLGWKRRARALNLSTIEEMETDYTSRVITRGRKRDKETTDNENLQMIKKRQKEELNPGRSQTQEQMVVVAEQPHHLQ